MLRTALLSTLAAAGLAANADAGVFVQFGGGYVPPPPVVRPACDSYEVLYRTCNREPWRLYRVTPSREEARHIERHLERHGYDARVRRIG